MALLPNINVGTSPNDGTGDSIRDAFTIVNENFQLIEAFFPNSNVTNLSANLTSTGISTFNRIDANLIYSSTVGNAGTLYYGNIATVDQPNITSLGNLTSLQAQGTVQFDSTFAVNSDSNFNGNVNTQANLNLNGSFNVAPSYTVANTYSATLSDYLIVVNVSAYGNTSVTLPNANVAVNKVYQVLYWDPNDSTSDNPVPGTGNISANTDSNIVLGSGTVFETELDGNSILYIDGTFIGNVDSITSNTELVLEANADSNIANVTFEPFTYGNVLETNTGAAVQVGAVPGGGNVFISGNSSAEVVELSDIDRSCEVISLGDYWYRIR
jgi:cytoskeletal protein CcmA (bactofilin family)